MKQTLVAIFALAALVALATPAAASHPIGEVDHILASAQDYANRTLDNPVGTTSGTASDLVAFLVYHECWESPIYVGPTARFCWAH